MEDTEDRHCVVTELLEHSIGEPSDQPSAIILKDDGMHVRLTKHRLNFSVDARQKRLAESKSPGLVPFISLSEILLTLGRDN